MYAKKGSGMKVIAVLLCVVLLIGGAVGGTLAWLIANTQTVTNTFTVGNIKIDLQEKVDGKMTSALTTDVTNDTFKMVPGTDLAKDPTVYVEKDSEACWLFVKVEAANGVALATATNDPKTTYITYTMADGWTAVPGAAGVYYRQVAATTQNESFPVLKDNKVHVLDTVTKAMMEAVTDETKPSLAFSAYAIQSEALKDANGNAIPDNATDGERDTAAAAAWALIATSSGSTT